MEVEDRELLYGGFHLCTNLPSDSDIQHFPITNTSLK